MYTPEPTPRSYRPVSSLRRALELVSSRTGSWQMVPLLLACAQRSSAWLMSGDANVPCVRTYFKIPLSHGTMGRRVGAVFAGDEDGRSDTACALCWSYGCFPAIEGIFRVKRGLRRRFRRHFQPFRGGGQGTLVLGEVEGADKGAPWHLILLLMRGANFDHTRSPAPRRWLSYTIYS